MLQPTKVATPATADFVLPPVHARIAAGLPGVVRLRTTELVLAAPVVTVFPPASWMATPGWVDQAARLVPPLACWVNAICAAIPTVIVVVVTSGVRAASVARSV